MNNLELYYTLLDLLKYSIDIDRYYVSKDYNSVNWNIIFELSKNHRVSALAYEGLKELRSIVNIEIDQALLLEWEKNVDHQKIIDFMQKIALDEIAHELEQQQIPYSPFKGFSLKKYYPKNFLREMTDLDFFVYQNDFMKSIKIIEDLGYEKDENYSLKVATLQKAPFTNVEIHCSFFDFEKEQKISDYFKKELYSKCDNKQRLIWNETINYIYLCTHMHKHMINGGIGIRFILDLWLFEQHETDNIDWVKVERDLKILGVSNTYTLIRKVMIDWFKKNKESECLELVELIFTSGTFGTLDVRIQNKVKIEGNKIIYILRRLFPSVDFFRESQPEMKIQPVLLPFYWLRRLVDTILHKRERVLYEFRVLKKKD